MRDVSQKRFLSFIDSLEVFNDPEKKISKGELDFCVINGRLSNDLIGGEEAMDEASFDDYGLWYAHGDTKPWLCLHVERDGLQIGMSISPEVLEDWANVIRQYPEHAEYLPKIPIKSGSGFIGNLVGVSLAPITKGNVIGVALEGVVNVEEPEFKTFKEMQDQECPLKVKRKFSKRDHSMCRTCPKMIGGDGSCRWDGWYNPFKGD